MSLYDDGKVTTRASDYFNVAHRARRALHRQRSRRQRQRSRRQRQEPAAGPQMHQEWQI